MKKNVSFIAIFVACLLVLSSMVGLAADLHNNLLAKRVISPVTVSNNTASVGEIVDRLGYGGVEYIINVATVADSDATFTPLLEHCAIDNCDDAAAVADASLLGTEAAATFTIADNNSVFQLGYIGSKRYTRLTITPASNTGAGTFSSIAILGNKQYGPRP